MCGLLLALSDGSDFIGRLISSNILLICLVFRMLMLIMLGINNKMWDFWRSTCSKSNF